MTSLGEANDGETVPALILVSMYVQEAAEAGIQVHTSPYPLDAGLQALADLAADRVNGAAVLVV